MDEQNNIILLFICHLTDKRLILIPASTCISALTQSAPLHSTSSLFRDYQSEDWVWDQTTKSPEVCLSKDLENAYFHVDPVYMSMGTAGVYEGWITSS